MKESVKEIHQMKTPDQHNESRRLTALYSLKILDTLPEERFDRFTRLAPRPFDVPIATNPRRDDKCRPVQFSLSTMTKT